MSFRNALTIGLVLIVLVGGCLLLADHVHSSTSDSASAGSATDANSAGPVLGLANVPPRPTVNVNGINFELATTTAEQEQGLSDRPNVPDNYAMLFVFPEDGQYGFWMKDMDVPLDMVWLTDNGTIASITPDVPANSYPAVFYPPEPIRYVLEMKAGEAMKLDWTAGMRVPLPLPYGQ